MTEVNVVEGTLPPTEKQPDSRKKIVVIGAGVGGLLVAQSLNHRKDAVVTLLSPSECFLFLHFILFFFVTP